MHLASMLDMIESGFEDRELLGTTGQRITGAEFGRMARAGSCAITTDEAVIYVGENHPLLPVLVFAAAGAGVPFVPVNYRLEDRQLIDLLARYPFAEVLADRGSAQRIETARDVVVFDDWLASLPEAQGPAPPPPADDGAVAVTLFTSGTTSEPKAAILRHRHVMAYLLGTVTFGSAAPDEAALIAVPPYHVAGIANLLSNLFAGRRLVYLQRFEPRVWLDTIRHEGVTNAMVVPTMLSRIVEVLADEPADVPTLRLLSYGGSRISERVVKRSLRLFPGVDFVNAYGLTETASTVAVLGPDDHRRALAGGDPVAERRLSSAGRVLPTIEVEIRDDAGYPLPVDEVGMVFLRGEQVAGEYAGGTALDDDGWFCTRDRGSLDHGGYLYIEGRADDTIIRGGENIAPAEIEDALCSHDAVKEACVVGVPDDEWGHRIAAAVVLEPGASVVVGELIEHTRSLLRGSRTPDIIEVCDALPYTATGKLLRRQVLQHLAVGALGVETKRED